VGGGGAGGGGGGVGAGEVGEGEAGGAGGGGEAGGGVTSVVTSWTTDAVPSVTASIVDVTAPANPNLAPPGFYQVFILNRNGVPSEGKIVRIQ